jgi:hypothetical protein
MGKDSCCGMVVDLEIVQFEFVVEVLNGEEGNTKQDAKPGKAVRHPVAAGINHSEYLSVLGTNHSA